MGTGVAGLGAAVARVPPAENSRPPEAPPSTAETSAPGRCKDASVAPDLVRKMVESEAVRGNVDVKPAVAIAGQESNFGSRVNSPAGAPADARGGTQLTADTAPRDGGVARSDCP